MKYNFNVSYSDLVHMVDKTKSTYYDDGIFKDGITFENYGLNEIMTQKAELVSDAMIMCWNLDHKTNFAKYCKNRRVAVQAGGFIGIYPKLLSQMFDEVYTFEPDPLNFHCLVNNCQSANVHKFNSVLGADHMLVDVEGGLDVNPGMFKVTGSSNRSNVPTMRIDDLALNECDLIQLDIEGFEINALSGAKNTIEKFKPIICCEVHLSADHASLLANYLSQWGYKEVEVLAYAGDRLYQAS